VRTIAIPWAALRAGIHALGLAHDLLRAGGYRRVPVKMRLSGLSKPGEHPMDSTLPIV
jgi:hypothetical protein